MERLLCLLFHAQHHHNYSTLHRVKPGSTNPKCRTEIISIDPITLSMFTLHIFPSFWLSLFRVGHHCRKRMLGRKNITTTRKRRASRHTHANHTTSDSLMTTQHVRTGESVYHLPRQTGTGQGADMEIWLLPSSSSGNIYLDKFSR